MSFENVEQTKDYNKRKLDERSRPTPSCNRRKRNTLVYTDGWKDTTA
jgi:hypothetical protein